jgi:DNA-directed RNA polymerase subunit RPC12/RpoP
MPDNCMYCREVLTWTRISGWIHPDGRSYKQRTEWRCPKAGHRMRPGGNGSRCPECGTRLVPITVDDHCALPDRSKR